MREEDRFRAKLAEVEHNESEGKRKRRNRGRLARRRGGCSKQIGRQMRKITSKNRHKNEIIFIYKF